MTTDRAFIQAYRQATPSAAPTETTRPTPGQPGAPHFLTSAIKARGRRAPLSTLMAERRASDAATPPDPPQRAANLAWPEMAVRLADRHAAPLRSALATLGESVVTLVGAQPGVGTTTATLALARAAKTAGLRVAVVDGNPVASDLALAMGVRRATTLAEAIESGAGPDDALTADEDGRVAVTVGGGPITPAAARKQLAVIAEACDLVLVDCGAVATASPVAPPTPWMRAANSVTLITSTAAVDARRQALEALDAARIGVSGIIENLGPAA